MGARTAAPARNGADTSAAPLVAVRRSRSGRGLVIERCPYCNKLHQHGDGGKRGPGDHGHRLAHCVGNGEEWTAVRGLGYYLVE